MSSVEGAPVPLRTVFHEELDQLRLQVELMGVRADQNLERMREILDHGEDENLVGGALAADDEIDAMHVSLLERCYQLLNREAPMATTCGTWCRWCASCPSSSGSGT